MTIGHRLREARIRAGFRSAAAAAQAFGWAVSFYCSHENGHRGVKLNTLERYARAFHVDRLWLLLGSSPEHGAKIDAVRLCDAIDAVEQGILAATFKPSRQQYAALIAVAYESFAQSKDASGATRKMIKCLRDQAAQHKK